MSPDEFAQIQRILEERALQQVAMLQRISGYLHVIEWAAVFCGLMLLFLVIK